MMMTVKTGQPLAGDHTVMLHLKLPKAHLVLSLELHTQVPDLWNDAVYHGHVCVVLVWKVQQLNSSPTGEQVIL